MGETSGNFSVDFVHEIKFYKVNDKLSIINSISMKNITYAEAVAVLELSKKNIRVTVKRKSVSGKDKHLENRTKLPRSPSREKTKRRHSSKRSQKSRSPSVHNPLWIKSNDQSIAGKPPVTTSSSSNKAKIVHVPSVHLPVRTKPERVVLEKGLNSNEIYGIQLGTRIVIHDVQPNSSADRHGLKKDDIIIDINGITGDNKNINQAVQLITSGSGMVLILSHKLIIILLLWAITNYLKWGAYSRWSFGWNSPWISIETMITGKMHPNLLFHLGF